MSGYLIVLAVAAGTTIVLNPFVLLLARRVGAVVQPDERRVHTRPLPTLGGLSMYFGLLAGFATASRIEQFDEVFTGRSEPMGILLGATIIFAVGVVDDLREVSPPAKLAGQVLAGSMLSLFGVTMLFFRVPLGEIWSVPRDLAPLITVLWVIGMANAVNLIDGLDGLAAGIVAIAAGAFFLYTDTLFEQNLLPLGSIAPLLAIITAGVCVGFLPLNFHPARIQMGDGGALLLGLLMACSTLLVGGQTPDSSSGSTFFFFAPLFIPFFILGVPILDTAFSIVRRASKRTGVATADKDHLHHRLMRLGHGQRRAVAILWAWTALLSGFVLYPAYTDRGNAVAPFGVAALGVALYTVLHPEARRTRADGAAQQLELDLAAAGEREDASPRGAPPGSSSAGPTGEREDASPRGAPPGSSSASSTGEREDASPRGAPPGSSSASSTGEREDASPRGAPPGSSSASSTGEREDASPRGAPPGSSAAGSTGEREDASPRGAPPGSSAAGSTGEREDASPRGAPPGSSAAGSTGER